MHSHDACGEGVDGADSNGPTAQAPLQSMPTGTRTQRPHTANARMCSTRAGRPGCALEQVVEDDGGSDADGEMDGSVTTASASTHTSAATVGVAQGQQAVQRKKITRTRAQSMRRAVL